MDRRQLLHRAALMLGGAISASAASGILGGCVAAPGMAPGGGYLTDAEKRTVAAMCDHILPRSDTPGALDVGVPAFIDRMLSEFYQDPERRILREGLRQATTDAAELDGVTFAELPADKQIALMREYDREAYAQRAAGSDTHFFRMMKELTILGYCTSEAGATKLLKYAPFPGPYRGDVPYSEVGKAWAL